MEREKMASAGREGGRAGGREGGREGGTSLITLFRWSIYILVCVCSAFRIS